MINDTISDMLTRVRNASIVRKKTVVIPYTRMNLKITEILEKEGYIQSFEIRNKLNIKKTKKVEVDVTNSLSNFEQNSSYLSDTLLKKSESTNAIKELKIYLKYYKKYKTNFYKLTGLKNKKALSDFKNLIKLLKGKQGSKKTPCITNLKRISKPGLRIYVNQKELPRVLAGAGIYILSTSKGILTDREARFRGVGGEVLCTVW
uniref:Small ribosomal subunit protein uS8c n=1 Tax=Schizomeris leibleinii TaxID=104533 RepID=F8SYE5_9CHLO|nr:ribosomal protein S8 [Schizomeris leibleinii]AEH05406.1 ribosomal protein S8 [Schizomeris leibleinii]